MQYVCLDCSTANADPALLMRINNIMAQWLLMMKKSFWMLLLISCGQIGSFVVLTNYGQKHNLWGLLSCTTSENSGHDRDAPIQFEMKRLTLAVRCAADPQIDIFPPEKVVSSPQLGTRGLRHRFPSVVRQSPHTTCPFFVY